jgi:hypothetical protein
LGLIKSWDSRWYAEKDYPQLLVEDIRVRDHLKKKLYHAGVSKIEIERAASKAKKAKVSIYTARPGIIIGKKGAEVENLKKRMEEESEKLHFEAAARIRDQISHLERVTEKQKIVSQDFLDQDVIGFHRQDHKIIVYPLLPVLLYGMHCLECQQGEHLFAVLVWLWLRRITSFAD